ncbi:hypothetical protein FACS1894142_3330 [Spirochaetia bacterium]|nr:hypothetical protein FACS1894142_3330 [Spirochaetia bacterium]
MNPRIISGIFLGAMAVTGAAGDDAIFTYRLGRFEVNLLVENRGAGRSSILLNADSDLLGRYIPGGTYQSETNTFLVRTGDKTIVVDTGFGTTIFDRMKQLGVSPDQVDAVLITHMHGDHIGGLQKEGKALFPRAAVFLAQQERDYFTKTNVNNAAVAALAPYGDRVKTFLPGDLDVARQSGARSLEGLPGIIPVAAFGHTPGHTAYLLESDGERLLIWGDLMHAEAIQFPVPGVSVTYDTDPAAAAAIRGRILDYAATQKVPVAGMHLVYPAIGTVTAAGSGYRFTQAK